MKKNLFLLGITCLAACAKQIVVPPPSVDHPANPDAEAAPLVVLTTSLDIKGDDLPPTPLQSQATEENNTSHAHHSH